MIWKDIKGFEGIYQVSEYGDIKALEKVILKKLKQGTVEIKYPEKILKTSKITKKNRYRTIRLCKKDGKNVSKTYSIHRIVYISFIGEICDGFVINHIDLNRNNNHYSNLEAIFQIKNVSHYWDSYYEKRNKDGILKTDSKMCFRCKKMLPLDSFYIKSVKYKILYDDDNRKYRPYCKNCHKTK